MDPNIAAALAKAAASEVALEAYRDLASRPFKEAGKLAEQITKTIRLVLFPVQLGAALQDRLDGYIDRAIRQVPESRLIAPMESIMLPAAEKLRFQEADNPVTELYINLLARAMDGERVGEAHPAFLWVISQLAPDEVLLLRELSRKRYTLTLRVNEQLHIPSAEQIEGVFAQLEISPNLLERAKSIAFRYGVLNQPEMFHIFADHTTDLGLVKHNAQQSDRAEYKELVIQRVNAPGFHILRLSGFGSLFYKACVSQPTE